MKRHPLDIFSLGAGISFLVLATALVVGQWIDWSINGSVVFPLLLVLLGGLGVYAAAQAQRANDNRVSAARSDSDGTSPFDW